MATLALAALSAPIAVTAAGAPPRVENGMYGVTLVNYKVNRDHTVTLTVRIRGLKMGAMSRKNVAGTGHWNIYVNNKLNNYSVSPKTGKTKVLKKGDYKVFVALVNNDGTPLSEPAHSKTVPVMVD